MFFIFLRRKSLKLRKKLKKMKTKLFVGTLLMWLTFSVTNVHADGIGVNLQTGGIDDNTGLPYPKSPIQPPHVELDGYTLAFIGAHADYILCLLDENDDVVFTTFVLSTANTVVLPGYLQGTYEIRLLTANMYFYGLITL